jgi:hypothetical protein
LTLLSVPSGLSEPLLIDEHVRGWPCCIALPRQDMEMIMKWPVLPALVLVFGLSGCARGSSGPDAAADMSGTPSEGAGGSIHCTYAYRLTNVASEGTPPSALELEERALDVGPEEAASETLGQLTLSARYDASQFEGNSFSLTVSAAEAQVLAVLFQFGSGLPQNQFAGGHGFTGLLYFTHPTAGGDYQAFCEVRR